MSKRLHFNGVNCATGGYLLPPMTPKELSQIAQGEPLDETHLRELKWRYRKATEAHLGLREGLDPKDISHAGWGVIFAFEDADQIDGIKEALAELLKLRQEQAGDFYRECSGIDAYRPGESKNAFLARHGAGSGPVDSVVTGVMAPEPEIDATDISLEEIEYPPERCHQRN